MSEHSILPPSRAARRMACPGSRALEASHAREESESAKEGTRAHEIAAQHLILKYGVLGFHAASPSRLLTDTDEMFEGAKLLAESIERHIDNTLLNTISVENRVSIHSIHPECFGTPDVWALGQYDVLHIWDYKFGHSHVDAFENWQLIAYASGILDYLEIKNINPVEVVFHIVQPRCYTAGQFSMWTITPASLLPYFERLKFSESASMQLDAKCNPSPQCKHCDASHVCKALQHSALEATETATENNPRTLTPDALGSELRVLQHAEKLLKARINGLEQHATTLLKKGKHVAHFGLEPTNGRQVWNVPPEKIKALGKVYGVELTKQVDTITPLQAEKAGIPKSFIRKYSERTSGGMKLVPDDGSKARKVFGGNK